jgi:hypothetical protein
VLDPTPLDVSYNRLASMVDMHVLNRTFAPVLGEPVKAKAAAKQKGRPHGLSGACPLFLIRRGLDDNSVTRYAILASGDRTIDLGRRVCVCKSYSQFRSSSGFNLLQRLSARMEAGCGGSLQLLWFLLSA